MLFWDDNPVGFLRANHPDRPYRSPGLNFADEPEGTTGAIGPMDLHEEYRGRYWGLYMIALAMEELAVTGCEQYVIDWTTLIEYYGKLGFEPWRRFERGAIRD